MFMLPRALRLLVLFLVVCSGLALLAQTPPRETVILISLDGWRWDYIHYANVPNVRALAARGVRSEGLIPSYPSVTFPNHYTIVTGLVPDRHGIVSNTMVDRTIGPERFTMQSQTAKDPRWWGGEPIWTTAIKQGHKSASMFWPGSEAIFPTYWKPYDGKVPNLDRVQQVLTWMKLPDAERPSVITLYFSDVDSTGHSFGPDSPELLAATRRLDDMLGVLLDGIAAIGFADRTTIILTSDHGMAQTSASRLIFLDDYIEPTEAEVIDSGASLGLNPAPGTTADALYKKLSGKHPSLSIYKKEQTPAWLRYGSHSRVPAIVGLAQSGWLVTTRASAAKRAGSHYGGAHGYDPRYRDMHGLFVAAGPRVRQGYLAPALQNVHLYNFMCTLLGLKPAPNDGDSTQTANFTVW